MMGQMVCTLTSRLARFLFPISCWKDHTSVNLSSSSSLSFPKLTTTSSKDLSVIDTASACSASSLVGGAPILTTSFRDGQCLACFNMAATLLAPHTTTGMDTVRGGREGGMGRGRGRGGEGERGRGGRGREGEGGGGRGREGEGGGGREEWRGMGRHSLCSTP